MAGIGAIQKKAKNILNVKARRDLLIKGINTSAKVDKTVHITLVGQRAFAALRLPNSEIKSIALNTLKSLADELFTEPDEDGRTGFAYLDALRVRLLMKALSEVPSTQTVEAKAERLEDKVNKLEARNTATEVHSIRIQKAHLSLYSKINGLIKNGEFPPDEQVRLYRVLENHHVTFADLFEPGMGTETGNISNVTKMR